MKKLFNLFEEMGYKEAEGFFRQGSLTDDAYPDEFFTFWNIDTPEDSFYDNKSHRYVDIIQVGFYTNNLANLYTGMDDFVKRAKEKGFVLRGRPKDANADKTGYGGRVCVVQIINNTEE